jgi:MFS family permease
VHFLLKTELWFPIWVIFLLDHSLSFKEVIMADIVFRISMTLLEFPLGSIGDKIGRKRTYFGGGFFYGIALIAMVIIQNFYLLLLSWFLWAIAWVLISGTDNAYIYEMIIYSAGKGREMEIFGYFTAIQNTALVISHLIAGFLFQINPNLPFILNGVFYLIASLLILRLPDPGMKENLLPTFHDILENTKVLLKKPIVRNLVFILSLLMMYQWTTTLILVF